MDRSNKLNIIPFSEVTRFHGHICPGTAIGYRAAEIAIKELGSKRAVDEEFLAIVENDSCSVDAIQVVTGCTFGKGNLIFKDHGKQVFTFINRNTGDALRLYFKKDLNEVDPGFNSIRKKAFSEPSTREDKLEFEKRKDKFSKNILQMSDDELFKIERVKIEIPQDARISRSVRCAKCGELVAEHRTWVEKDNIVCIPCSKK